MSQMETFLEKWFIIEIISFLTFKVKNIVDTFYLVAHQNSKNPINGEVFKIINKKRPLLLHSKAFL